MFCRNHTFTRPDGLRVLLSKRHNAIHFVFCAWNFIEYFALFKVNRQIDLFFDCLFVELNFTVSKHSNVIVIVINQNVDDDDNIYIIMT